MKKIIKNILIIAGALFITLNCTGDFEKMNENPLAAKEVSPKLILPKMLDYGFNCRPWEYQVGDNLHTNLYAQYFANTASYFPSGRYEWKDNWVKDGFWRSYYVYLSKNLHEVKQMLEKNPQYNNMYQIMRIISAMGAARTTDCFGDVPYFEAGQGIIESKYDSQKDIYYDIFKELTEAATSLKSNKENQDVYGNQDILFGGDLTRWIKLANSLRLRYALRLSFIDAEKAKKEGEAALKETLMTSNADNAGIKNAEANAGHSLWTISFWNEFRVSKTMIDIMLTQSSVHDPRLPLWFSQTQGYVYGKSDIQYQGVPNGLPASELTKPQYTAVNNSCVWGLYVYPEWNQKEKGSVKEGTVPNGTIVKPQIIMNYAEVCFLKAEAALRGWATSGNAKVNYEEGILASFAEARQGVNSTLYSTKNDDEYIHGGNVKWKDTNDFETKLKQIITQKWIAIYPNGTEAWTEFRRTGYPLLTPVVQSDLSLIKSGEFIKKFRYIDDERNLNRYSKQTSLNQGKGDGQNIRVWWDTGRYK
ncbi:SusD/RagB family nutrient-binding outer membrane lipoprotein [Petrimonas sulfuriphila]|uniref:SusD/RagB family nutrient-binding outer membrane lipoprotein n=1 Tax=Petrimonas sulfuriphila TaxID=285070 RepID=UPI000E96589E|nr:SusD/RagB family nutrient-binding outer membrane lipoprotein [Porphyromonadaceae bacterium]HBK94132.1 SusD/RagB family nutrient-binding outer membrane lipoprotein [Porphyromonadaceae bacterium]HBU45421.1 SusD/RagB family nutrient-binding outer membrane lipoprotein [Porphyromonadaceae bacterium]HBX45675.1 SusD/RagB family nutrient-binding outer membrane lipoprotein [Porphyromonadaceae bacterium]